MPELRRDPIIGRWVIISTERGRRPTDFRSEPETHGDKGCPFCPGNEKMTPGEIIAYGEPGRGRNTQAWTLRVVPNKYPALEVEGVLNRQGEGMYDKMNGIGAHEVIIETPDHNKEIPDLTDQEYEDVIWAYRDRIIDLKRDFRFEYILIFKNRGMAAGATLSHPHSQLIATPIVPKRVREEVNGAKNYYDYKERCGYCDIIKQELAVGSRVVAENDGFIALCPFASRFPFEMWVLPKTHDSEFINIQRHEAANLASLMKNVINKMNIVLDKPPYNYLLHMAPLKEPQLPHYHWHIEIIPKLTKVAGFEWGTGFYINPVVPEEAAKYLREAE